MPSLFCCPQEESNHSRSPFASEVAEELIPRVTDWVKKDHWEQYFIIMINISFSFRIYKLIEIWYYYTKKGVVIIFSTEKELVENFLELFIDNEPWSSFKFGTEFNYIRGKTDIIAISELNEVIAIEAKLNKWRDALQQAYRNRCFANKSYVLLPYETAISAYSHELEFEKRGVGICCIQDGEILILKEALIDEPIQPWLNQMALQFTMEE